jgi:hypothetical protein
LKTNSLVPGWPSSGVPGVPGRLGVEARVSGNLEVDARIIAGGGSVAWLTAVKPRPTLGIPPFPDIEDNGDWLLLSTEIGASGGEAAASKSASAAMSIFIMSGITILCERKDAFESEVPGREFGAAVPFPNLLLRGVRGSSNLMLRAISKFSRCSDCLVT